MPALLSCRKIEKICVESFRSEKITKNKPHFIVNLKYTGGCIEWDSKEWDRLFLIGATREILEIRKEWDSIEWDN